MTNACRIGQIKEKDVQPHLPAIKLPYLAVRLANKAGDKGGLRLGINLIARADLLDTAIVHHGNPIGHGQRFGLIMGDIDKGHARLALDRAQFGAHMLAQFQIQRRQRLVQQQNRWFNCQRAGNRHTLLVTARQGIGLFVALIT